VSDEMLEWLREHSAVNALNVATGRDRMANGLLQLEIQRWVQGVVSVAMCEVVNA